MKAAAQEMGAQGKATAQEIGAHVQETMTEYYGQGCESLRDVRQTLAGQIRAQPLQALLVAGGLGIGLALLTRRRSVQARLGRTTPSRRGAGERGLRRAPGQGPLARARQAWRA
jgi:hypothetical protein